MANMTGGTEQPDTSSGGAMKLGTAISMKMGGSDPGKTKDGRALDNACYKGKTGSGAPDTPNYKGKKK